METIKTGNRGYKAEISVVTYCRSRKEADDRTKFRILLVSFRPIFSELFMYCWKNPSSSLI